MDVVTDVFFRLVILGAGLVIAGESVNMWVKRHTLPPVFALVLGFGLLIISVGTVVIARVFLY